MGLATMRPIAQRGDPGLFSVLGKIGRAAVGFATGGVAGAVGALQPRVTQAPRLPPVGTIVRPGGAIQVPASGFQAAVQRFLPGGETGLVAAGCPKGHHLNKAGYHTLAGFVPAMSRCVKNRRRNLSNGRANTRSLRRMAAWEKQDKRRHITLRKIAASAK